MGQDQSASGANGTVGLPRMFGLAWLWISATSSSTAFTASAPESTSNTVSAT